MRDSQPGDVTRVAVSVPDGHPLGGTVIDLYPASGATTYLEGRVVFTSPLALKIERELAELRATLASMTR